jgi:hypothetical protein
MGFQYHPVLVFMSISIGIMFANIIVDGYFAHLFRTEVTPHFKEAGQTDDARDSFRVFILLTFTAVWMCLNLPASIIATTFLCLNTPRIKTVHFTYMPTFTLWCLISLFTFLCLAPIAYHHVTTRRTNAQSEPCTNKQALPSNHAQKIFSPRSRNIYCTCAPSSHFLRFSS